MELCEGVEVELSIHHRDRLPDWALDVWVFDRAPWLCGRELLPSANVGVENGSVGESAIGEGSSSNMSSYISAGSFSRVGGLLVVRGMREDIQYLVCVRNGIRDADNFRE